MVGLCHYCAEKGECIHVELSDADREEIIRLVQAGRALPARYRASLFDDAPETELIWPGKTTEVERVVLPFQSIEHIDEPRSETVTQYDLFSVDSASGRQTGGWTNKLIWGDNKLILSSLVNGPLRDSIEEAGGLRFVYIDPPFDVGADFTISVEVGDEEVTKEPSVVEEVAYRDTWGKGRDSFLAMISQRLRLIRGLMSPTGTIAVHCDWRLEAQLRLVMDEVFGSDSYLNTIAWCYTGPGNFTKWLPRRHDTILWYSVSKADEGLHCFNRDNIRIPYVKLETGKTSGIFKEAATLSDEGKVPEDYWTDITPVARLHATELLGYPTQKPEALARRLLEMATRPDDLVADFFCGSGTTLAVAEKLGRKWIGADLGRFAIHTTRKRLIQAQRELAKDGQPYRAFEILNLGSYERQYFAGIDPSLPDDQRTASSEARAEQYLDLILSAYGATRSTQLPQFHGVKDSAAVFVGPIDAPVTQRDVTACIAIAKQHHLTRVDILGFEFEMGIKPAMIDQAKDEGVTLTLRYVPTDVFDKRAVQRNQVHFYDVGYLDAKPKYGKNRTVSVQLENFAVFYAQQDADGAAEGLKKGGSRVVVDSGQVVRVSKDKKGVISKEVLTKTWTDWIDYWSVDFDFESQRELIVQEVDGELRNIWTGRYIFENQWQDFRSKGSRDLSLTSAEHSYDSPGEYRVAVKVIDIFGNDTTKVIKVKVK